MDIKRLFEVFSEEPGEDPQIVGLFGNRDTALDVMSQMVDRELDYLQGISERLNYQHYPEVWESKDGKAIVISTMEVYDDPDYNTETEQITYYLKEVSVYG